MKKVGTDESYNVLIEGDGKETQVTYKGLPPELEDHVCSFTNQELLENPVDSVRGMIRMHATVAGGIGGLFMAID